MGKKAEPIIPWWVLNFDIDAVEKAVSKYLRGGMPPLLTMEAVQKRLAEALAQVHYGRTSGQKAGSFKWAQIYKDGKGKFNGNGKEQPKKG